jgi:hypothetical protein
MMVTGGEQQCKWAAEVVMDSAALPGDEGHIQLRAVMTAVRCTPDRQLYSGIDMPAPRWQEVDWDPEVLPAARIDRPPAFPPRRPIQNRPFSAFLSSAFWPVSVRRLIE